MVHTYLSIIINTTRSLALGAGARGATTGKPAYDANLQSCLSTSQQTYPVFGQKKN
jgi:hypothetical protein